MVMNAYKNLTPDELKWADHCFESGNTEALAKLQELSASREGNKISVSPSQVLAMHIVDNEESNTP